MAASNPNPIAIFASGNRSRQGYAGVINSNLTDPDGSDAQQIYRLDSGQYALLRRIQIYSRGTNNGASAKAHIWFSWDGGSTRECIKTKSFDGSVGRGIVCEIDMDDITPPTDANPSPQQGFLMGQTEQSEFLYIQIEDSSISDGYRVMPLLRDYSKKDDLNNED